MTTDAIERAWPYTLNFKISDRPLVTDSDEDRDLIQEFTGEIVQRAEGRPRAVGKVRGMRLDLQGAADRRCSMLEVCDAHSQELYDCYTAMFNHDTDEILEELALDSFGDLLFVCTVEIAKKHRGLKLGLLALLETVRTFGGGCALAVIKPFPLQFSGNAGGENALAFRAAQEKLRGYWRKLGFTRVKKTDYYYIDLARRLPSPEEVLGVVGAEKSSESGS
jgi:hypothetical protein